MPHFGKCVFVVLELKEVGLVVRCVYCIYCLDTEGGICVRKKTDTGSF
jgi:hypothetical protein